jgi:fumarate reductase flavoprotein subunit
MTDAYDVVVVGAGAAGLCASLEAARAGARVLLVEREGAVGGSSALSGGLILAAGTSVQHELGIHDTPDALLHEYLLFNRDEAIPWLARRLAHGSAPAIEWLCTLGVEFERRLVYGSEERVPRSHVPVGRGAEVTRILASHVKQEAGIDIALGQRLTRIVMRGGRACGVAVDDDAVGARSVVLACGGFGANPALWAEHLPSVRAAGGAVWYIGSDGAQGDALAFAAEAGAWIEGHDRALLLPRPNFVPGEHEPYSPGWLVMVTRAGRRCVDESTSYAVMQVAHKQHGPVFAILDEAARRATVQSGTAIADGSSKHPAIVSSPTWNAEMIEDMVRQEKMVRADTIAELARRLGIHAPGLSATIRRYNDYVAGGEDREYFKPAEQMLPVATPPYYGVEMRLAVLCLTQKGPVTDADGRVLDVGAQPIPGLYAAGECTGGVIGSYMGSGNAWANCLVFGREAGRTAAAEAQRRRAEP